MRFLLISMLMVSTTIFAADCIDTQQEFKDSILKEFYEGLPSQVIPANQKEGYLKAYYNMLYKTRDLGKKIEKLLNKVCDEQKKLVEEVKSLEK